MVKELNPDGFQFHKLKVKYPYSNKFYSYYCDGDYYNRAYTEYYDENKVVLERDTHGYYG